MQSVGLTHTVKQTHSYPWSNQWAVLRRQFIYNVYVWTRVSTSWINSNNPDLTWDFGCVGLEKRQFNQDIALDSGKVRFTFGRQKTTVHSDLGHSMLIYIQPKP